MNRSLGWIAIGGLGLGAASLSLAYAIGGRTFEDLHLNLSRCDRGNPQSHERHLAWDDNDAVEISLPGSVYYRGGEGSDIVVRGPPDLVAHVELKGGRLTLNCRGGWSTRNLEVTLPGRPFRRINLSGSSKLLMENVDQPDLALAITGSGSVRAQGTVDRAKIRLTGSGQANLGNLTVKQLTLDITGSGKVEADAKDSADIKIAGSGDVRLLGRPASLSTNIAGSGRITSAP
jgi:hypothetical protein